MSFNTKKSHLLHLRGPPPDPNVALELCGEPLEWKSEVIYLGVPLRLRRTPSDSLPLELPRAWAALHKAGLALSPYAPIPLKAQLKLIHSDVLAGVLYPAAVQDLDYKRIDVFVNTLLRRLTGCAPGSSATFLRCELGLIPSKFLGDRRILQYWRHVTNDAWFARLLPSFHGQGPLTRLREVASKYCLEETTEVSLGATYPIPRNSWQARVREAVDDEAVKFLQAEAAKKQLPGPEIAPKKNHRLKLVPRLYVREGGELAKYGVVFRQCVESRRFPSWDERSRKSCQYCQCENKFGHLDHLLSCTGVPQAFAESRHRISPPQPGQDPVKLVSDELLRSTCQVAAPSLRVVSQQRETGVWAAGVRWKKGKVVKALVADGSLKPTLTLLKLAFKLAEKNL